MNDRPTSPTDTTSFVHVARMHDRSSGGLRLAGLTALAFFARQSPVAGPLWGNLHRLSYADLREQIIEIAAWSEVEHPTLKGSFSANIVPYIFQDLGSLPEIIEAIENSGLLTEAADDFGNWFDAALDAINHSNSNGSGAYTTPRPIANLMARLAAPSPQHTVFDPACGFGSILASASRMATGVRLFGQDVNALATAFAAVRIYLIEAQGSFAVCDSLRSQIRNNDENQKFDLILCDPPFGTNIKLNPDNLLGGRLGHSTTSRIEVLFIESALSHLTRDGRAIILLPRGFLNKRGSEAFYREQLLHEGRIEGAIALPGGAVPWTELPVAILVLRGHSDHSAPIRLVDAHFIRGLGKRGSDRLTEPQVNELVELYNGPPVEGKAGMVSRDMALEANADILPATWLQEPATTDVNLKALRSRAIEAEADADAAKSALEKIMSIIV